jgi:hypothetical protein
MLKATLIFLQEGSKHNSQTASTAFYKQQVLQARFPNVKHQVELCGA